MNTKEKKFVVARVKGKSKRQAGLDAGATTVIAADKYANRLSKNVKIQQAIEQALATHELTPDYAIKELKTIVDQNREIGAKRLAIKDVLELHGYKKDSSANLTLNVKQGFFKVSR